MGYQTYRTLKVDNETNQMFEELIVEACPGASFEDEVKWYDYERDMREFSRQYPDYVFSMHCEGEDNADIYECHFKAGQMQTCRAVVTIAPYDESNLA